MCVFVFATGRGLCLTVFVLVTVFFLAVYDNTDPNMGASENVRQMLGRRHALRPHEHVSLPLSCALWASARRTLPWGPPTGVVYIYFYIRSIHDSSAVTPAGAQTLRKTNVLDYFTLESPKRYTHHNISHAP